MNEGYARRNLARQDREYRRTFLHPIDSGHVEQACAFRPNGVLDLILAAFLPFVVVADRYKAATLEHPVLEQRLLCGRFAPGVDDPLFQTIIIHTNTR